MNTIEILTAQRDIADKLETSKINIKKKLSVTLELSKINIPEKLKLMIFG